MKWLWTLIASILWGVDAYLIRMFYQMEANANAMAFFLLVLFAFAATGWATWQVMFHWFNPDEEEA
jgi:hypothetical protein